jgi:hypothetical protein
VEWPWVQTPVPKIIIIIVIIINNGDDTRGFHCDSFLQVLSVPGTSPPSMVLLSLCPRTPLSTCGGVLCCLHTCICSGLPSSSPLCPPMKVSHINSSPIIIIVTIKLLDLGSTDEREHVIFAFWAQLIWLSVMNSSSIHFLASDIISFFMAE